ncbi:major facilitator superfamily domain-containing protein [Xylariales sp. PMI_506]|nr:major facilitator superfamily domain-containing protein [Xylariales sp. PMI_506]
MPSQADCEKAVTPPGSDNAATAPVPPHNEEEGEAATAAAETPDASDAKSIAGSVGNQRKPLSTRQLLVAFPTLCAALFVSFFDQTSVSTCIPAISAELGTGAATSWIGASFLISSTAFQLINGRLSDIFGRKNLLLGCLALLGFGDLLCGFAKSAEQLFAFRALAGIGGGGVNSIAMIVVSDITTLENRGKYQGIVGAVLALANGIGPFIGGAVIAHATWRWVFWIVPMLAIPAALVIWFVLPLRWEKGDYAEKVKQIDFGGIILSLASVLLLLIPLSGGGVSYAWNSATFIAMFTIGIVLWILFILFEWKLAKLPIMPLRLFVAPHCVSLYGQSFLLGLAFYCNYFYCNISLYFQVVCGYSALISGAIFLPMLLMTSLASVLGGLYMTRVFRYRSSVILGFAFWTLGNGLTYLFDKNTSIGEIIPILMLEGVGSGLTLQPTLIGILANTNTSDRAVCTGLRNFLRTIGGSFGIVVSGAILSNTLSSKLAGLPFVTEGMIASLTSSAYSKGSLGLTAAEEDIVLIAYMDGIRYAFAFYTATTGLALILALGIGNTPLNKEKSPKVSDEENQVVTTNDNDEMLEGPDATRDNENEKGSNLGMKSERSRGS